ncbi:reverse transcriptase domain-containing protein [Tanacetum coccineum]
MEKHLSWVQDDIRLGVVKHKICNDIEFEMNSNFMRELRHKLFNGTEDEDAHEHVRRVLEIADLFHFPGVTHDVVMLRVFPITLKRPALRWINRLSAWSITTWDLLEKTFIKQYCPPFKTAKKLEEIRNLKQEVDEPLYRAWARYNNAAYDDDTKTRGRFGDQGDGRIDGQGGQVGGQDSEVNDGVNRVPEFSTIIAQQLQNLLLTIVAQVGYQGRGQGKVGIRTAMPSMITSG